MMSRVFILRSKYIYKLICYKNINLFYNSPILQFDLNYDIVGHIFISLKGP